MIGGELLGKLIILSFRDDEEALFSKAISALSSVADFSTATASAEAPLLFGSLQIDPPRRLVWQAGQTVYSLWVMLCARNLDDQADYQ